MKCYLKALIAFIALILTVGNVTAQELTVSPNALNFGWVRVGEAGELTLTFINTGQSRLEVQRVEYMDWDNFEIYCIEVLEAQTTLLAIYRAGIMYRHQYGEDPSSVEELIEFGYIRIRDEIAREWRFSLIGSNPIVQIEAVSTDQMMEGAGHFVLYDVFTNRFTGFTYSGRFNLAAHETRPYVIRFIPTEVREFEENLTIYSNDPENDELIVTMFGNGVLKVGDDPTRRIPNEYYLSAAYPNPFNSTTTIRYGLPYPGLVSLQVYNPLGQCINTLFEGYRQAGVYTENMNAGSLPSGLYLIKLNAGEIELSKKVMLVK